MSIPKRLAHLIKRLPQKPGVYLFKDKKGRVLYIGKAINIKERVRSHFQRPSFREAHFDFLKEVANIDVQVTDSEIEALLLEAALIRKYLPPYNVAWRDDKNYFYVGITNEKYPRVFLTHQINLSTTKIKNQPFDTAQGKKSKIKNTIQNLKILYPKPYTLDPRYVGPFVDGKALKTALRVLRRIFPYRTCGKIPHRACLWYQIHEKEAPCEGTMSPKEYRKLLKNLIRFLEGKKGEVIASLAREMKRLSKNEEFERAAKIRDQIAAMQNILAHAQIFSSNETVAPSVALRELKQILRLGDIPQRIEGYDISNIQGKEATGSMVVFIDGQPAKQHYRKFKIRHANSAPPPYGSGNANAPTRIVPNDVGMLKEMITRRAAHQEWPYPDLMLIDGGIAQLRAARSALGLTGYKQKFTIVALAKRQNLLYLETQREPIPMKSLPQASRNLLTHIRDEAHRFAITYHRKLHRKQFEQL